MTNFHTVAVFQFAAEYAVLKLLLEQENIRHFFQNETFLSVLPFYPIAGGGIQLKVHQEDVKRAKQIIADLNDSSHLKKV